MESPANVTTKLKRMYNYIQLCTFCMENKPTIISLEMFSTSLMFKLQVLHAVWVMVNDK